MVDLPTSLGKPRKSILRTHRTHSLPVRPLSVDLSTRIAPEIVDVIIDYLHGDKQSLSACCLVCKAWLPTGRYHLRSRLSLHKSNAASFFQLIDAPKSTLGHHIRHLSIQQDNSALRNLSCDDDSDSYYGDSEKGCSEFRLDDVLPRMSGLPSISSLCLSWVMNGLGPAATSALLHGFPNLTELEFRSCAFPSLSEFAAMISAHQNLQRLALSDVEWFDLSPPSNKQSLPPLLHILELYITRSSEFLSWLLAHRGSLKLDTVMLGSAFWDYEDAVAIGALLRSLGPTLRHLSLCSPSHLSQVDLTYNRRLRTLHISHIQIDDRDEVGDAIQAEGIETMLSQLTSPEMVTIVFHMLFRTPDAIRILDWGNISRILARPYLANLQCIEFRVPKWKRRLRAFIGQHLPECTARGIVFVDQG